MLTRRKLLQATAITTLGINAMTDGSEASLHADVLPSTGAFNPDLQSFDDTMTAFMQKRNVPGGSLAVVKDGKLVYARGYGVADKDTGQRVQPVRCFASPVFPSRLPPSLL